MEHFLMVSADWRNKIRPTSVEPVNGAYADGLLDDQNPLGCARRRHHVAVDAFGFFCKPLQEGGCIIHLSASFGQRLAFLERDDGREVLPVHQDEFIPAVNDLGTLLGARLFPSRERPSGGVYRHAGLGHAKARQLSQDFSRGRIVESIRAMRS
jgi:hypothetical protein